MLLHQAKTKFPLLALMVLLVLPIFGSAMAQERQQPETPPLALTREQAEHRRNIQSEMWREYRRQFDNKTFEDYDIAYFVSETAFTTDSLVSPDKMSAAIPNLHIVTSNELLVTDADTDLLQYDLTVIHVSALDWLDEAWLHAQYSRGMPIMAVGMRFEDIQRITGDYCTTPLQGDPLMNNPTTIPDTDDVSTVSVSWVIRDDELNEQQRQRVIDRGLNNCQEIEVGARWGLSAGYFIYDLRSAEDGKAFADIILGTTKAAEIYRNSGALILAIDEKLKQEGLLR